MRTSSNIEASGLIPIAILSIVLISGAVGLWYFEHENDIEQAKEAAAEKAADAVTALPPGVQDAWVRYIQKTIEMNLVRERSLVYIPPVVSGIDGQYISLNTPYQIDCDPINISVTFGQSTSAGDDSGDDDATAALYFPTPTDDTPDALALLPGPLPPLGVSSNSIAAQNLSTYLCRVVALVVGQIMAR